MFGSQVVSLAIVQYPHVDKPTSYIILYSLFSFHQHPTMDKLYQGPARAMTEIWMQFLPLTLHDVA